MSEYGSYLNSFVEILKDPDAKRTIEESQKEFCCIFPEEADGSTPAAFAGFVLGMLQATKEFLQDYTREEIEEMRTEGARQRLIDAVKHLNKTQAEEEDETNS